MTSGAAILFCMPIWREHVTPYIMMNVNETSNWPMTVCTERTCAYILMRRASSWPMTMLAASFHICAPAMRPATRSIPVPPCM